MITKEFERRIEQAVNMITVKAKEAPSDEQDLFKTEFDQIESQYKEATRVLNELNESIKAVENRYTLKNTLK